MWINEKKYIPRNRLIESAKTEIPEGFTIIKGSTTAPVGYSLYGNNKSFFNGERIRVLVKDK